MNEQTYPKRGQDSFIAWRSRCVQWIQQGAEHTKSPNETLNSLTEKNGSKPLTLYTHKAFQNDENVIAVEHALTEDTNALQDFCWQKKINYDCYTTYGQTAVAISLTPDNQQTIIDKLIEAGLCQPPLQTTPITMKTQAIKDERHLTQQAENEAALTTIQQSIRFPANGPADVKQKAVKAAPIGFHQIHDVKTGVHWVKQNALPISIFSLSCLLSGLACAIPHTLGRQLSQLISLHGQMRLGSASLLTTLILASIPTMLTLTLLRKTKKRQKPTKHIKKEDLLAKNIWQHNPFYHLSYAMDKMMRFYKDTADRQPIVGALFMLFFIPGIYDILHPTHTFFHTFNLWFATGVMPYAKHASFALTLATALIAPYFMANIVMLLSDLCLQRSHSMIVHSFRAMKKKPFHTLIFLIALSAITYILAGMHWVKMHGGRWLFANIFTTLIKPTILIINTMICFSQSALFSMIACLFLIPVTLMTDRGFEWIALHPAVINKKYRPYTLSKRWLMAAQDLWHITLHALVWSAEFVLDRMLLPFVKLAITTIYYLLSAPLHLWLPNNHHYAFHRFLDTCHKQWNRGLWFIKTRISSIPLSKGLFALSTLGFITAISCKISLLSGSPIPLAHSPTMTHLLFASLLVGISCLSDHLLPDTMHHTTFTTLNAIFVLGVLGLVTFCHPTRYHLSPLMPMTLVSVSCLAIIIAYTIRHATYHPHHDTHADKRQPTASNHIKKDHSNQPPVKSSVHSMTQEAQPDSCSVCCIL